MSLYTEGKEYQTLDGVQYIGYYHKIRQQLYTGKKHVFDVSKKLRQIQLIDSQQQNYYPYAMKYKQFIQGDLKVDYQQLSQNIIDRKTIQYPVQFNILKDKLTKNIYDVNRQTFDNNKDHTMLVAQKITIKIPLGFSNVAYNKNRIKRIKDKHIRQYIQNMLK